MTQEAIKPDLSNTPDNTQSNLPVVAQSPLKTIEDIPTEDLPIYANVLAELTIKQTKILMAILDNIGSENMRPDYQIAADLGVDKTTIVRARRNPKFQRALELLARDSIKGLRDKIITKIYEAGSKDWGALKFLLQFDGSYVQSQRNVNLNASVSAQLDAPQSPKQAIYTVVERFIGLGYDLPRLIDEISNAFNALRNEGV